ncbi:aspartate-semialdehyde dehydrogenase [Vulcanimicrobium alpinum]|uniref:Aspartate-semialdehyde dehydrogenase n=1 Tax=Vulcanimicrobium alpinum TaxID=3016050 RepID=A0AAN2C9E6_UNVUL|nr:aspartate-semialdehyde dehydrogenase [Vulcanimicrobium alpinum]BDE05936.1 aspartate-semialdehyde dehydrogenase [Vulcanimicrobium alpinum]
MKLGLIGATGVVGGTILRVLDEREIAVDELLAYASRDRADGLMFRGRTVSVVAATRERLLADRPDVAFFASSDDASAELATALVDNGTVVIDNTSTFRLAADVPLVIPEVNPHAVGPEHRLFPVANCTAIVLSVALAPIERAVGLRSVRVATYQAVSGAGRAGLDALAAEERGATPNGTFAAPIHHNVVPQVGSYDGDGDTGEEQKVVAETRKMLDRPDLRMAATTVRVPVMRAHSEAVFIETARATSVEELQSALRGAPGVVLHERGIVTPRDVEDTDLVHVARLRPEPDDPSHTLFQLWVVGDQLRKGAATNGVQILELLIAQGRFASRTGEVTLSLSKRGRGLGHGADA